MDATVNPPAHTCRRIGGSSDCLHPQPAQDYQQQRGAWAGVSLSLRVQGLPPAPMSPQVHLSIGASVSQSSAPPERSQQNRAHPHVPCPPPAQSHSPLQRPKHSSMSPVQKPTPNQRRTFVHITGPQQSPADLTLRPLLPGRGVQGEGGEGTGEEPSVPELDFTLSHLQ